MSTAPRRQLPSLAQLLATVGNAHRGIRAPSAVGLRHSGQDVVLQVSVVLDEAGGPAVVLGASAWVCASLPFSASCSKCASLAWLERTQSWSAAARCTCPRGSAAQRGLFASKAKAVGRQSLRQPALLRLELEVRVLGQVGEHVVVGGGGALSLPTRQCRSQRAFCLEGEGGGGLCAR